MDILGNSQALLEFFFSQFNLLWVLGFSVELNNAFIFLQHALQNAHFTAVS